MPKQGQSVESCILTEIKKKKGDSVAVGELLFAYETDKASFEEESKVAGQVLEVFFNEGDEVPVLTNVMVIGAQGESVEQFRPDGAVAQVAAEPQQEDVPAAEVQVVSAPVAATAVAGAACGVSPRARHLAEREAINLSTLVGSGPNGRIIERDVKAAIDGSAKMTPLAKVNI